MQSSGKSCILKTVCYCTWVDKRLELSQKVNGFGKGSAFIDIMTDYYQMAGYVHPNTYIEYETSHLKFSYDHSQKSFNLKGFTKVSKSITSNTDSRFKRLFAAIKDNPEIVALKQTLVYLSTMQHGTKENQLLTLFKAE